MRTDIIVPNCDLYKSHFMRNRLIKSVGLAQWLALSLLPLWLAAFAPVAIRHVFASF
jgi:hypothetical protein